MSTRMLAKRRYSLGFGLSAEAFRYFSGWIIAAAVLAVAAPLTIGQFTPIAISVWSIAITAGKWFSAVVVGGFLYTLLPILVAQGMTRREITVAMGVLSLLWSAALGAVAVAGYTAEQAYYSWFDWRQTVLGWGSEGVAVTSLGQAFTGSLPVLLSFAMFGVFGALIAAAVYRWDGTGLLVLVAAVPIGLAFDAGIFAGSQPFGPEWLRFATGFAVEWPFPAAAAGTAIAIGAAAAVTARILADIPIRPKSA